MVIHNSSLIIHYIAGMDSVMETSGLQSVVRFPLLELALGLEFRQCPAEPRVFAE